MTNQRQNNNMLKMFSLKSKKAIVTGASGGLGRSMAEALAEAGAEVVLVGVSAKSLKAAEELRERGLTAHGIQCDLSKAEEVRLGFEKSLRLLGGEVDILLNGAGIIHRSRSEDLSLEHWQDVLDVNLTAAFLLCQLVGRNMIERGSGGKIINISSMNSFFGGYTVLSYAASKGGVSQLTKGLCNEWAKYGINVNAIAPGFMDTPLNAELTDPSNPRFKEITSRIPAGRWGTGDDLKGLTVFLASSASDYINGAVIPCDGGYLVK